MRDNQKGMPEILDVVQEGEHYFCLIQLERPGEKRRFRFGVSRDGYLAIKRVLQLRPFDQAPGLQHRYFFVPATRRLEREQVMMTVRVEQERYGKQVETEAPRDLVANLVWFYELNDWTLAGHLAATT